MTRLYCLILRKKKTADLIAQPRSVLRAHLFEQVKRLPGHFGRGQEGKGQALFRHHVRTVDPLRLLEQGRVFFACQILQTGQVKLLKFVSFKSHWSFQLKNFHVLFPPYIRSRIAFM